ncbi:hypothetical protein RRG08_045200 [Elysia crispata]|uniref:Uncharacterized protein n=1 Tax=Elysia crispata TaxID=231223 RepID=A0AAE1A149_9GAST|nr:hypothetical protein RRG08_045200 [Elysia crispata]
MVMWSEFLLLEHPSCQQLRLSCAQSLNVSGPFPNNTEPVGNFPHLVAGTNSLEEVEFHLTWISVPHLRSPVSFTDTRDQGVHLDFRTSPEMTCLFRRHQRSGCSPGSPYLT